MQLEYEETKINTKYGNFNLRVYADSLGKETFVLSTDKLDCSKPILTRVHSECLTGDLLSSLQCDCGPQLHASLRLLQKEGGILIYLRQEGRGIGLFNKIKTYNLQREGYDTFDANVVIGRNPDERTYEMVKTVLNDFGINSIRLITNNPSKIAEIAKLGIQIVERVALIIPPNEYNNRYYFTKESKFHHLLNTHDDAKNYYYFGVSVDNAEQIRQLTEYVKNRIKDPFLKIHIAISLDHEKLSNREKISHLNMILQTCNSYSKLIPVLHFSFLNSQDTVTDLLAIKEHLPLVKLLQLNDLSTINFDTIKFASNLFSLIIPFSDNNFEEIHNKSLREIIKQNRSFVLLDQSNGKGIKESKNSFMKKIDTLLSYGLNDIALAGGFGPDSLNTYFEIRRYYRINFSIDAETKLKTDNYIDIEKVKIYLFQLLGADDPNQKGILQTKAFLRNHNQEGWEKTEILNEEFLIHPHVFNARVFPSTSWFSSKVCQRIKNHENFCEIGCGAGITSILVSLKNPKTKVVATDISRYASENTLLNAKRLGVMDKIEVMTGDVLDAVPKNYRFDFIFWALPFGYLDPGAEITLEENQFFDPGYKAIRKFFQTAKDYLKPKGKLLMGFSTDLGHFNLLEKLARENRLKLNIIDKEKMKETEFCNFELLEGLYLQL